MSDPMHVLMELIDEQKDNMQENRYIQLCNLMKHLHELNKINRNDVNDEVMHQIEQRYDQVFSKYQDIMKKVNEMKKPYLTNDLKVDALLSVGFREKKINDTRKVKIHPSMYAHSLKDNFPCVNASGENKLVNVTIYPELCLGSINITDEIYLRKTVLATNHTNKFVKQCKDYLLEHGISLQTIKKYYTISQKAAHTKIKHEKFKNEIDILCDEMEFLVDIWRKLE